VESSFHYGSTSPGKKGVVSGVMADSTVFKSNKFLSRMDA